MIIRRAIESDVPAIPGILNREIREGVARFVSEPIDLDEHIELWRRAQDEFPWLVASEQDGHVVGFARASQWKARGAYAWTAEISAYVDPRVQGRGIGTALYELLVRILRDQGYRSVVAGIALPNDASVRLHESLGMHHAGTLRQVGWKAGRWRDVGYWVLALGAETEAPGTLRSVSEVLVPASQPGDDFA